MFTDCGPTQSRRDQEEGGELDSHEEVRHFCGSRRDEEEGGGAGPSREPRRDPSREVELGSENWTCLLLQLFLNSCATDTVLVTLFRIAVETAIVEYTSCFAMARSPLVVVLTVVHGLLGLLRVRLSG